MYAVFHEQLIVITIITIFTLDKCNSEGVE